MYDERAGKEGGWREGAGLGAEGLEEAEVGSKGYWLSVCIVFIFCCSYF